MIDPLIIKLISLCFALLLLGAAWHKLARRQVFRAILADYRLLPNVLVTPVAMLIPLIEVALGILWLTGIGVTAAAIATAALLFVYMAAIAINLLRGRIHISCGCGLSTSHEDQPLSWVLIARNLLFSGLALLSLFPSAARSLEWTDFVLLLPAMLAVTLLYGAFSQLLQNGSAIGAWRDTHE